MEIFGSLLVFILMAGRETLDLNIFESRFAYVYNRRRYFRTNKNKKDGRISYRGWGHCYWWEVGKAGHEWEFDVRMYGANENKVLTEVRLIMFCNALHFYNFHQNIHLKRLEKKNNNKYLPSIFSRPNRFYPHATELKSKNTRQFETPINNREHIRGRRPC